VYPTLIDALSQLPGMPFYPPASSGFASDNNARNDGFFHKRSCHSLLGKHGLPRPACRSPRRTVARWSSS